MEPLKTHKQNSNHRYSENSNTNNWCRLDSITDGNNSSYPNTPKRNKVVMPNIPEITEQKYDIIKKMLYQYGFSLTNFDSVLP